jgi:hypothetical protein
MLLGALLSRGLSGRHAEEAGGAWAVACLEGPVVPVGRSRWNAGGGGGMLSGGLGGLFSMLSGGRGFSNAGGLLSGIFGR